MEKIDTGMTESPKQEFALDLREQVADAALVHPSDSLSHESPLH